MAEGVESHEVWERHADLGCDLAQGFHVPRPLPAEAMAACRPSAASAPK